MTRFAVLCLMLVVFLQSGPYTLWLPWIERAAPVERTDDGTVPQPRMEQERVALLLLNVERVRAGVAPVRADERLFSSAEEAANATVEAAHAPDWASRIRSRGRWDWIGEMLGLGQKTPGQLVNALMGSPSHRRMLLDERATHGGVGYAFVAGRETWAVHLGEVVP